MSETTPQFVSQAEIFSSQTVTFAFQIRFSKNRAWFLKCHRNLGTANFTHKAVPLFPITPQFPTQAFHIFLTNSSFRFLTRYYKILYRRRLS